MRQAEAGGALAATRLDGAADVVAAAPAADVTVWVEWTGDRPTLASRLRAAGLHLEFTLERMRPDAARPSVWRACYSDAGAAVDGASRVAALLKKLERAAPWLKVERNGRLAPEVDAPAHLDWDVLGRRALP